METATIITNCLNFEQLQAYSLHKTNELEREQLYIHISSCELCASAVNGFSALPFSFDDLAGIHHQIDVKTNASHAQVLTFKHVSIVIVSLCAIIGFYQWITIFSESKTKFTNIEKPHTHSPVISGIKPMAPVVEPKNIISRKKAVKTEGLKNNLLPTGLIPIKEIESIPVNLIETKFTNANAGLKTNYFPDVIYIYDLKVSDYSHLYFNHTPNTFDFKGHIPPSIENKENINNITKNEDVQSIPTNKILKQGLKFFNREKYEKANASFQLLLENNPDDINALFYGALSLSHIGNYYSAIIYLERILKNTNNVFYEEAKWNLALLKLRTGEEQRAKELLKEIEIEKGFYSKKAGEKLNDL